MARQQNAGKNASPNILRRLRDRLFKPEESLNSFHGVYADFPEASRAAPPTKPVGYDAADSANWYLGKLNGVSQEDYPVIYWLREAFADSHSIFEIGGHVGVAYYGFERILPYPQSLKWTILDVPTIATAGADLAKQRGRDNIRFVTAVNQTDGADILLACGALQYIDQPNLSDMIASFSVKPKHVLINTTPVYDGTAYITLQNIGSAYCPYRIFNRRELIRSLTNLGYSLVDFWQKERAVVINGHPEKSFEHYSGFYFRKA